MFVVPIAIALCSIGILNSILKIVEKQIYHNTRIKKITVNINQIDYYFDCNVEQVDSIYNLAIDFCTKQGQSFGFTVDSFDQCTRPLITALQKGYDYNGMLPFKIHFTYKHTDDNNQNDEDVRQQSIKKVEAESITTSSIVDSNYQLPIHDLIATSSASANIKDATNDFVHLKETIQVEVINPTIIVVDNDVNIINTNENNNTINYQYIEDEIDYTNSNIHIHLSSDEEVNDDSSTLIEGNSSNYNTYTNNDNNNNYDSNKDDNHNNNYNDGDNNNNKSNDNSNDNNSDSNTAGVQSIDKKQTPLEINGITYIFEYIPTNDIDKLKVDANKLAESFCILHGIDILNEHPIIKNKLEITNKELEQLVYKECYLPLSDAIYNTIIS